MSKLQDRIDYLESINSQQAMTIKKYQNKRLSDLENNVIDRMRAMNDGHELLNIVCAEIEPGTMSINIHYKPKAPEWKVGDTVYFKANPMDSNRGIIKHIDGDMAWIHWNGSHNNIYHTVDYLGQLSKEVSE